MAADDSKKKPDPALPDSGAARTSASAYAKAMAASKRKPVSVRPFQPPRVAAKPETSAAAVPTPSAAPTTPVAPTPGASALAPRAPAPTQLGGFIKTGAPDNNYRKVAKFLILVGKDEAARILAKLDPTQVERVSRELATIKRVENAEAEALLAEFKSLLSRGGAAFSKGSGGIEAARELLRTAFGDEKGEAYLRKAVPEAADNPFLFMEDFEGDQIALLLKDEHAAAVALVLSRVNPKTAAAALGRLEPGLRMETVRRLAKMGKVAPEVLERTAAALREKARTIGRPAGETVDGRAALAEILKRAGASLGDRLLEELAEADPELGRDIADRLFTLDDILKVEDKAVQEKLRAMTDRDIAVLIKGRRPSFTEKVLSNISSARRAVVQEERELIGPVPRAEADEAANLFLAWFRQGREEGRIVLMDDADLVE
jgi:flagellar motor switch protein FliG